MKYIIALLSLSFKLSGWVLRNVTLLISTACLFTCVMVPSIGNECDLYSQLHSQTSPGCRAISPSCRTHTPPHCSSRHSSPSPVCPAWSSYPGKVTEGVRVCVPPGGYYFLNFYQWGESVCGSVQQRTGPVSSFFFFSSMLFSHMPSSSLSLWCSQPIMYYKW